METSGGRMNEQPDKPELADIAKEAMPTQVKRKRGRPQIIGPRDDPPSPAVAAAVLQ